MTHNAKHSTLDAGALGISDCLEARSSAPHEVDDWHWAQTLSVYLQWLSTLNTDLRGSSELWCFKKSTPFTLKGHNFCSRISETMQIETLGITSASSALATRRKGKREKHAAIIHISVSVCVCVFVCMFVYHTVVSLNMKLSERLCLKLMSQHFNWISICLPLVSMDRGSPTPPGNMIITFLLCISL